MRGETKNPAVKPGSSLKFFNALQCTIYDDAVNLTINDECHEDRSEPLDAEVEEALALERRT